VERWFLCSYPVVCDEWGWGERYVKRYVKEYTVKDAYSYSKIVSANSGDYEEVF